MQNYGAVIKRLRKEKGYTLNDLAKKSELTAGFLSKIERGVANPSFNNLQKICYALGVSSNIFEEEAKRAQTQDESIAFIPKDQRTLVYNFNDSIRLEAIYSHMNSCNVNVLTIAKGEDLRSTTRHSTDELGIVLKGAMVLSANGQEFPLGEGDAIFIRAETEHMSQNAGECDCVSCWIRFGQTKPL